MRPLHILVGSALSGCAGLFDGSSADSGRRDDGVPDDLPCVPSTEGLQGTVGGGEWVFHAGQSDTQVSSAGAYQGALYGEWFDPCG